MKKIFILMSLCLFACITAIYQPIYFTFEESKVCASKATLLKLFPSAISQNVGDENISLFHDYITGIGSYILIKRHTGCWEAVDLYPPSQPVIQARLVKPDSLVVWYEIYKDFIVTQSYKITETSITPY